MKLNYFKITLSFENLWKDFHNGIKPELSYRSFLTFNR